MSSARAGAQPVAEPPAARTTGGRRESARVGRFGPRSLAARLLTVLLVPMIGFQVFAFREVRDHQKAASSAGKVSAQVSLLQYAGLLIVPLYTERTATDGITRAESLDIDRSLLNDVTGIDFLGIMLGARAELDAGLVGLMNAAPEVKLASGITVGQEVEEIQTQLAGVRTAFDSHEQAATDVDGAFTRVIDLLSEINDQSAIVFEESATSVGLTRIGAETEQFLEALEFATAELRYLAETGISGGVDAPIVELITVSGAFTASLDRLRGLMAPERRPDFDALVSTEAFTTVATALPIWMERITQVGENGIDLISDPAVVRSIIDVLPASLDRLQELQEYGNTFLGEEVRLAESIQTDAAASRHDAINVMIAALGVSLVLLLLVLVSILRPLRRLLRQSRQVGEGDLAVAQLKPTGPTDIRLVMHTFNEMATTLRAYDSQVRRLAQGHTELDRSVPGPLGETLRQSVSHLAAVTTKLHESEAAANLQARTDALTGLGNRMAAFERLAEMSSRASTDDVRGAIVFLDLDGFKSINDTQGHGEGDRILGEIGARLLAACPDDLVARIGGDEFIVLIEQARSQDDVVALARELIGVISVPCRGTTGQLFAISASAGVALIDGSREPLDCVAQADSAVYHAKERGRGRVEVYDERLARDIEDRADMALTMREGLSLGQFSLRLQPIIEIATKQPVGAEALLRWNRPGVGEVGPSDFIPIAERTGVILDLDAWVIDQAVNILEVWSREPLTSQLRMAVNISGRHIIDGSLSPMLHHLCSRAGVDPSLLDLEITETHLVADVARASAVVDDLRRQGIRVAIDDFGTGYSSMGYLHQLTVDTLKIDRVFVSGMCDNEHDRTIVELLLRLGDSLGLKVVAEGVDSEEKLALLQQLGCPWAQGYYIAMPMLVPDATVWLRQQVTLAAIL